MFFCSMQRQRHAHLGIETGTRALCSVYRPAVKGHKQRALTGVVRAASSEIASREVRIGVFIEVDKVLVDAHNSAHRVAFNQAFKDLGYKSVRWSPDLFWQLLRSAAATPDSIVTCYFNTLGWPSTLAPEERQQFTERIQEKKNEILADMVQNAVIPLRPGVQQFLEEAVAGGAAVALLGSTCSAPSEGIVDAALAALGPQLAEHVCIFQCPQGSTDLGGEAGSSSDDDPFSLERNLHAATARRRQEEAQAFLETVNRSKLGKDWREKTSASDPGQLAQRHVGEGLAMDPSLLVATQRFSGLSAAWLAACCAMQDVPPRRFALLAGSNPVLKAAQGAGILAVAVPSSFSGRGSYSADVVMDSFGAGGGVTWSGLRRRIEAGKQGRRSNTRSR